MKEDAAPSGHRARLLWVARDFKKTVTAFLQRQEARGMVLFAGSTGLKTACDMVASLVAVRLVLPEDIGVWQGVALIQTYTGFLELGILKGLNRQFSFLRGAGKPEEAVAHAAAASGYTVLWSASTTLVTLIFLGWQAYHGADAKLLWALLLFLVPSLAQPWVAYYEVLYRSGQDFGRLGWIQIAEGFCSVLALLLVWFWGWQGYFVRAAALVLLALLLRHLARRVRVHPHWNSQRLKELVGIGLKMLVCGYIYGLFQAADRSLVLMCYERVDMGYYSLVATVQSAILVIPTSLSIILYSRMSYRYGQTRDPRSLMRLAFYTELINAAALLLPSLALWYGLGPFVQWFLPKYADGIAPARWSVIAGYILCMGSSGNIFGAMNRVFGYGVLLFTALGLMWGLSYLAYRYVGTLESIAQARTVAVLFLTLGINWLAYRTFRAGRFEKLPEAAQEAS